MYWNGFLFPFSSPVFFPMKQLIYILLTNSTIFYLFTTISNLKAISLKRIPSVIKIKKYYFQWSSLEIHIYNIVNVNDVNILTNVTLSYFKIFLVLSKPYHVKLTSNLNKRCFSSEFSLTFYKIQIYLTIKHKNKHTLTHTYISIYINIE